MSITRFPLYQQWGHIGSELERVIHRQEVGDYESSKKSIERILNMMHEMTIQHQHEIYSLKELTRFKEFILEHYLDMPTHTQTLSQLKAYAYSFIIH